MFRQDSTCPVLLFAAPTHYSFAYGAITRYDQTFQTVPLEYWVFVRRAAPISLATTLGISVDFYSSAYLDVSVQQVRFS